VASTTVTSPRSPGGQSFFELPAGRRGHFVFRHRLSQAPPLQLDALGVLASRLPEAWVIVQEGDIPFVSPPRPKLPTAAGEAIASLGERCLSVRLYHVQHTPGLGRLVHQCLDEVQPWLGGEPMARRDASVFIGSPGQVIPVHCDRHHNFLVQVTGRKEFMVGRFHDEDEELSAIERHYPAHLNLEREPDEVTTYRLGPGEGMYLPPYTIHWVRCGPEPSVALSCSFSTPTSDRAELVHECNALLRRVHATPRGPGGALDPAKAAVARAARRLRHRRDAGPTSR